MGMAALAGIAGVRAWAETNFLFRLTPNGESALARRAAHTVTPLPWPGGKVPYDISRLTEAQQQTVHKAMQRWQETGAAISFVPRSNEVEYVNFTGKTDAGNNTSLVGFQKLAHADINISAFWWTQGEWMPVHELGHALGFFHEHARWDRDAYVTIHYENMKPERQADYNWVPKTNWITSATPYDYYSIMHYRTCWSSAGENQCRDGDGESPCAVIDPVGTNYDGVIGQWSTYGISPTDALKARAVYGALPERRSSPAAGK